MLEKIEISGFRGFSKKSKIVFSRPNGTPGSGLNIIVGANNSGKTTIIESMRYLRENPNGISFSTGKRNKSANSKVEMNFFFDSDKSFSFVTPSSGGSQVEFLGSNCNLTSLDIPFVVPSRRNFNFEFHKSYVVDNNRDSYLSTVGSNSKNRSVILEFFETRIFQWESKKDDFNSILFRILGDRLDWYIDESDNGQHYIAFDNGNHTAEGIGDGIWSVFTIVDALYDSKEGSIIVIDEPELSLHPEIQKRIMDELIQSSSHRQIIISTHSPYFINWEAIYNGASLIRVVKEIDIDIYHLNKFVIDFDRTIISSSHPHTFGINANETFFLEDKIILVEGQEDIICFKKILKKINKDFKSYNFFGWGANGADNMIIVVDILNKLGYKKVVAILDGDEAGINAAIKLKSSYPNYTVKNIPTKDIRNKTKYEKKNDVFVETEIEGICSSNYEVKNDFIAKYSKTIGDIFNCIDLYFK